MTEVRRWLFGTSAQLRVLVPAASASQEEAAPERWRKYVGVCIDQNVDGALHGSRSERSNVLEARLAAELEERTRSGDFAGLIGPYARAKWWEEFTQARRAQVSDPGCPVLRLFCAMVKGLDASLADATDDDVLAHIHQELLGAASSK